MPERAKADQSAGAVRYWRTLEEWAEDPAFLESVEREFAPAEQFWLDQPSRRTFLKHMAASFALAGLTGCFQQPEEKIIPYVNTPEKMVPGVPLRFATAVSQPGGAVGVVVTSHEGRPTKIDGNELHPASAGAADTFSQASLLDLYDPHRSKVVRQGRRISNWTTFLTELQGRLAEHRAHQGAGLALLTGEILSPTVQSQLADVLSAYPQARWFQYEPGVGDAIRQGAQLAAGQPVRPRLHLSDAKVVLSIDADFLTNGSASVRLSREFMNGRRLSPSGQGEMNRLYVAESCPSLTGGAADHWFRANSSRVLSVLLHVARELGVPLPAGVDDPSPLSNADEQWAVAVAADLKAAGEAGVVIVGEVHSPEVQALGLAINQQLGSLGSLVTFVPTVGQVADHTAGTVVELSEAMSAGEVQSLLVCNVDVIYSAPSDLGFAESLKKVPFSVHYGLHVDETARASTWHLPATHYLESWGDALGEDGTASIQQPLIARLYEGRSPVELFNILLERTDATEMDTVRSHWLKVFGAGNERRWDQSLHDGVIEGTAGEAVDVQLAAQNANGGAGRWPQRAMPAAGEFEVHFRTDPSLFDGRYVTNGWLQELPRPFSNLVWMNAAWVSPADAGALKVKSGDVIELKNSQGSVRLPVWIQPGQPSGCVTVHLGNGRRIEGVEPHGSDVGPLRSSDDMWRTLASLKRTGKQITIPQTQHEHVMHGRDLVRSGSLDDIPEPPEVPEFMHVGHHAEEEHSGEQLPTLYPDWPREGPQWGMSINLSACHGCNACVIACQSENNTPVVGPEQVIHGREMHWLRIDNYYAGEPEDPELYHQPVMCMHCEHAPCEPVCPVGATTHSHEGLNEMTYNRCIGTRYCSNNCPYKVRRFNFLDYREESKEFPVLQLVENPNVSVRSRGVMEKCTYCVQRISGARIAAKMEGREIAEGEVVTACQQACPTQAIVFGNIDDPQSQVAKAKAGSLDYGLLTDLNTRPRTTYLAAVKNPNPALSGWRAGE